MARWRRPGAAARGGQGRRPWRGGGLGRRRARRWPGRGVGHSAEAVGRWRRRARRSGRGVGHGAAAAGGCGGRGDCSARRQGQGAAARAQWRKGTGGVRVDCVDPIVIDVCTNLKYWKMDKKKTFGRYIGSTPEMRIRSSIEPISTVFGPHMRGLLWMTRRGLRSTRTSPAPARMHSWDGS